MNSPKKVLILCILSTTAAVAASCAEVTPPKSCNNTFDCEDNEICSDNICVIDPCQDGLLSEGESDVDCGHGCRAKCEEDRACKVDEDCKHNSCVDGLCVDPEKGCSEAGAGELLITEIMNNAATGKLFESYTPASSQTEFIEIFNHSDKSIALSPITVQCVRMDDDSNKTISFPMKGCLKPKNAAVISYLPITDLPDGVVNIQSFSSAGMLTNTAAYSCKLVQKSYDEHGNSIFSTLHAVKTGGIAKTGISEVLDPLEYSSSERPLFLHTEASISEKMPAGTKHSPGYCTNGALYLNNCDTLCGNAQQDAGETDVDCGGSVCNPCESGLKCDQNSDCISELCLNHVCEFKSCTSTGCPNGLVCDAGSGQCHSCSDETKNGDETDVDCGGLACGRCQEGKTCASNNDCESFNCENNVCTGEKIECVEPSAGELVISEILNNASSSGNMASFVADAEQKQVEFVEVVNLGDKHLNLDNVSISLSRLDKSESAKIIALKGCLPPHQAAVVAGSEIKGMPQNAISIVSDKMAANFLTNTATYKTSLMNGEEVLQTVYDTDAPSSGISHVLEPVEYSEDELPLVNHTSINASLKHSPGYCTNGALFENHCEMLCENEQLDSGETDIDCGGLCSPCGIGKACINNADCDSNSCENSVCVAPKCTDASACPNGWCNTHTGICESCSDNIKNGTETDVDCGGLECGPCDAGKVCQAKVDCYSYTCESFVCVGDPIESFKVDELIINEVMGSPRPSQFFSTQSDVNQCEFIEIVSLASVRRNLNGWSVAFRKSGTEDKPVEIPLFNILEPKNGIVIHNCSSLPLPSDMHEQVYTKTTDIFANTSDYDIWLTNGTDRSGVVLRKGLAANGQSQTRLKDLDLASDLVFHDTVNVKNHNSPGYCANGGLFSEDCITTCINQQIDEGETDVDCGGPLCEPCENEKTCQSGTDCISGYCNDIGRCEKAPCQNNNDCEENWTCDTTLGKCISCSDGVKNGDETDVDCGGSCSACEVGKACKVYSDCANGICNNTVCEATQAVSADPEKLIVNEVFDSSSTSKPFSLNADVPACEFIEIANPTTDNMNLYGLQLVLNGTNGSGNAQSPTAIDLYGVLKSKNLLVIHNCANLPLPDDAVSFYVSVPKLLTGTWTYDIDLVTSSKTSTQISSLSIGSVSNSSFNRNPDMTAGAEMAKTTAFADYAAYATPGYCLNGGLYSDGCKTQCQNERKDGDETDVDCGGPTCSGCVNDKLCTQNSDCLSNQCNGGRCAGDMPVVASISDLVINEVMGAPKSSANFAIQTGTSQCEFVEIVNKTSNLLNVDGIVLNFGQNATDMSGTPTKKVTLMGNIPKNGVLVVSEKEIPMPSDGINILGLNSSMTNGSAYAIWLSKGAEKGGLVKRAAVSTASGKSQNRSADLGGDETLIWHTDVTTNTSEIPNSPGYCANGSKFSSGCH